MKPSLDDVINSAMQSKLLDLNICFPCTIQSFSRDELTCTIRPDFDVGFIDGTVEDAPIIKGVPILMPLSTKAGYFFEPQKDDRAVAICSQRSLDEWYSNGSRVPSDLTMFQYGDAFVIPSVTHPDVTSKLQETNAPDNGTIMFGETVFVGNPNPTVPGVSGSSTSNMNIDAIALLQETVAIITPIIAGIDAGSGTKLGLINQDLITLLTGEAQTV